MEEKKRPEAVDIAWKLWLAVVAGECLHQILNVVTGFFGIGEVKQAARESMNSQQLEMLSDAQLTTIAGFALIIAGLIAMTVMVVVAWTARTFLKGGPKAEGSRRFLTFFAAYFAFRGVFVFELALTSTVPLALVLSDGIAQLLVAVLAVLAALFGGKKESVEWARATPAETP